MQKVQGIHDLGTFVTKTRKRYVTDRRVIHTLMA